MIAAYIALGSNLGNPELQLRRAVTALGQLADSQLRRVSSLYRSAAVGPGTQPDYLNAVAHLDTGLPALALLDALQAIELDQGRERAERWGPRTLDLDLLLYGALEIRNARLTVPHPRLRERNFALHPLAEICGADLRLPDGTDIVTLLGDCPAAGLTRLGRLRSAG